MQSLKKQHIQVGLRCLRLTVSFFSQTGKMPIRAGRRKSWLELSAAASQISE